MIKFFNRPWNEVPTAWLDVETTGVIPGVDGVVQVAVVRFGGGEVVGREVSLIDSGRCIPEAATAIHGISSEMVKGAPTLMQFFERASVLALLAEAQPGAYNAPFDRGFLPLRVLSDWTWPWLDPLVFVRVVDRYVRGQGRHKLEAACQRRDIKIVGAHDASVDAEAAGRLFYKIAPEVETQLREGNRLTRGLTLGPLLRWQREQEAVGWFQFNEWLSRQPPRETRGAA